MLKALLFILVLFVSACGDENCTEISSPDGNVEYYECPGDDY